MRIFWTTIACLLMALGLVGALALVNMVIPFITDPTLARLDSLTAVIYVIVGVVAFFFWRGFQQTGSAGFWARIAGACKANW